MFLSLLCLFDMQWFGILVYMFVWNSCWEVDPIGAKKEVLDVANKLGLDVVVGVAYEVLKPGLGEFLFLNSLYFESNVCLLN